MAPTIAPPTTPPTTPPTAPSTAPPANEALPIPGLPEVPARQDPKLADKPSRANSGQSAAQTTDDSSSLSAPTLMPLFDEPNLVKASHPSEIFGPVPAKPTAPPGIDSTNKPGRRESGSGESGKSESIPASITKQGDSADNVAPVQTPAATTETLAQAVAEADAASDLEPKAASPAPKTEPEIAPRREQPGQAQDKRDIGENGPVTEPVQPANSVLNSEFPTPTERLAEIARNQRALTAKAASALAQTAPSPTLDSLHDTAALKRPARESPALQAIAPAVAPGSAPAKEPVRSIQPQSVPAEPAPPAKPARTVRSSIQDIEPEPAPEPALHEKSPSVLGAWIWGLLSFLACIGLLFQLTLHFRSELAQAQPQLKPALQSLCGYWGCQLSLPHKIDLIDIEGSDLNTDRSRPEQMQLTATLHNRASQPQEWPFLEITLTDAKDRAVLRRALAPTEYLKPDDEIAKGFPARSEQVVQLSLQTIDLAAVGYRLYVFYP